MVTIGVGVAAFNSGNNLLFLILGFMLSLIILSGVMSEIVLSRVRLRRRLAQRSFAGSTSLIELVLENRKGSVPSYSLEVEDVAESEVTLRRCYYLKVAAGEEQTASYRRTPSRRGYLRLTGFKILTRYPFGIFEKWREIQSDDRMLVYPELLEQVPAEHRAESTGPETPSRNVGSGTDLAGLRGHHEGDEARAIHWRRSAALGKLVVVERHSDQSARVCVRLDNARPKDADADWDRGFEHSVSLAATIAVRSARRGLSVEVLTRGRRSPLVASEAPADPILGFLAVLQAVDAADAPALAASPRDARVVSLSVEPIAQELP